MISCIFLFQAEMGRTAGHVASGNGSGTIILRCYFMHGVWISDA